MGKFLRRTIPSATLFILGLVALLVVAMGGMYLAKAGGSSWGGAASWGQGGAALPISVKVGDTQLFDDQLIATTTLPAGQNTFQVSTADPTGHTALLVQLRGGLSIRDFVADLATVNSGATEGKQAVNDKVDNVAGAIVNAQCTTSLTVNLTPGTYYLIDFRGTGIGDAHPKVQQLQVTGHPGAQPAAVHPDAEVVLANSGGKPRYEVPAQLPSTGTFLVRNTSTSTNETAFLPLKAGTTDQALQAFFAGMDNPNQGWANAPVAGSACGLAPMSPGRSVLAHLSVPPGSYVLASFALDLATQKRAAQLGMYKIVNFVQVP